jgi:hypothetical protein
MWMPQTRAQADRNATCSAVCAAASISATRTGLVVKPRIACAACGGVVKDPPPSKRKKQNAVFCSRSCRAKAVSGPTLVKHAHKGRSAWTEESLASYLKKMTGESNPAWKGGATYKRSRGNYVGVRSVRCPPDLKSMAMANGYVMEHRLVMARWVGRALTRTECVHHIDHNPLNNARENLELWPCNRTHKLAEHGRPVDGAANLLFPTALGQR